MRSVKYFFHFCFNVSCWFCTIALDHNCDFLCCCKEDEKCSPSLLYVMSYLLHFCFLDFLDGVSHENRVKDNNDSRQNF